MSAPDSSRETVERLAQYITSGEPMTDAQLDEAAATLRALLAERDAARDARDAAIREVANLGRELGRMQATIERIATGAHNGPRCAAIAQIALAKGFAR